jgi:hypothetical protein
MVLFVSDISDRGNIIVFVSSIIGIVCIFLLLGFTARKLGQRNFSSSDAVKWESIRLSGKRKFVLTRVLTYSPVFIIGFAFAIFYDVVRGGTSLADGMVRCTIMTILVIGTGTLICLRLWDHFERKFCNYNSSGATQMDTAKESDTGGVGGSAAGESPARRRW